MEKTMGLIEEVICGTHSCWFFWAQGLKEAAQELGLDLERIDDEQYSQILAVFKGKIKPEMEQLSIKVKEALVEVLLEEANGGYENQSEADAEFEKWLRGEYEKVAEEEMLGLMADVSEKDSAQLDAAEHGWDMWDGPPDLADQYYERWRDDGGFEGPGVGA